MARTRGRKTDAGLTLRNASTAALLAIAAGPALASPADWPRAHIVGRCDQAVKEARAAADTGDPTALLQLSDWYFFGTCLLKDNAVSAKYARAAADLGSIRAAVVLGQVYMKGLGVPVDRAEAERWLTKAADAGDPEGALVLAQFYLTDPQAQARALPLAQKAADHHLPGAYAMLGVMYGSGAGVPVDYAASRRWLDQAVASGLTDPSVEVALSWATLHLGDYEATMKAAGAVPESAVEFRAAQINRAHAMLLNGQLDNARELYEANRALRGEAEFIRTLKQDFGSLRAAGIDYPAMKRIERLFGVTPAETPPGPAAGNGPATAAPTADTPQQPAQ